MKEEKEWRSLLTAATEIVDDATNSDLLAGIGMRLPHQRGTDLFPDSGCKCVFCKLEAAVVALGERCTLCGVARGEHHGVRHMFTPRKRPPGAR